MVLVTTTMTLKLFYHHAQHDHYNTYIVSSYLRRQPCVEHQVTWVDKLNCRRVFLQTIRPREPLYVLLLDNAACVGLTRLQAHYRHRFFHIGDVACVAHLQQQIWPICNPFDVDKFPLLHRIPGHVCNNLEYN